MSNLKYRKSSHLIFSNPQIVKKENILTIVKNGPARGEIFGLKMEKSAGLKSLLYTFNECGVME